MNEMKMDFVDSTTLFYGGSLSLFLSLSVSQSHTDTQKHTNTCRHIYTEIQTQHEKSAPSDAILCFFLNIKVVLI